MRALTFILVLGCFFGSGGVLRADHELVDQNRFYQHWWDSGLELNFDKLPTKGSVPEHRMPYSGYYYPDSRGGTAHACQKYDMAFNGRRLLATAWEQWDTSAYTEPMQVVTRGGFFGRRVVTTMISQTPHWHGHCNGWAAAAIRHAEPERSVVKNGVTFTPADIKALLAELYMYSQYEELKGTDNLVDAAGLHITLANWLGLKSHPLAMEAMPGREKWNYPIYAYESNVTRRSSRQVDVRTNLFYVYYSNGEYQRSPRFKRYKQFHYALNLNERGNITGGHFYSDSSRIDLLWVPLYPARGGTAANPRGNPHIDPEDVLALWRASVSEEAVARWVNVDAQGESLRPIEPQIVADEEENRDAPARRAPITSASSAPAGPGETELSLAPPEAGVEQPADSSEDEETFAADE